MDRTPRCRDELVTPRGGVDTTCGRCPRTLAVVFRRTVRPALAGARVTPRLDDTEARGAAPRVLTAPRLGALERTAGCLDTPDRPLSVPRLLTAPRGAGARDALDRTLRAGCRAARGAVARAGCERDA